MNTSLQIKLEEDPRGITCLGSLIYVENEELHIRYLNKNEQYLNGESQPNGKIMRFQHITSFSPLSQKNGVIIGEFCRIQRLTSKPEDMIEQTILLAKEMNALGITNKQMATAFTKKFKSTNNQTWRLLHNILAKKQTH